MEKEISINIIAKTWEKDSHGLYDFENSQIKAFEACIKNDCKILRKKMDIRIADIAEQILSEEDLLCEVKKAQKGRLVSLDSPKVLISA